MQPWERTRSNVAPCAGRVLARRRAGRRRAGQRRRLRVPRPTAKDGSFRYDVDITDPAAGTSSDGDGRRAARPCTDVRCRRGSAARCSARRAASASATRIDGLAARRAERTARSSSPGRRARLDRAARRRPVALYTYQLSGTITDATGKPVQGAVVITRTAGPRLLDVLVGDRRERPLHVVLRRRPTRRRPIRCR